MIKYTITSGTPTKAELKALEMALAAHKRNEEVEVIQKSKWARHILRKPLDRNV